MVHYLRRADTVLGERNLARLDNDFDPPVSDSFFAVSSRSSVEQNVNNLGKSFGEVFDEYVDEERQEVRSSKTIPGYLFLRRIFDEVVGANKSLLSINGEDCKKIRDILKTLPANSSKKKETRYLKIPEASKKASELSLKPLAVLTANGYLADLSAFFKWAVVEEYADKNPAKNLKVGKDPTPQHKKRWPFS